MHFLSYFKNCKLKQESDQELPTDFHRFSLIYILKPAGYYAL